MEILATKKKHYSIIFKLQKNNNYFNLDSN